jgi:hypothetical protein
MPRPSHASRFYYPGAEVYLHVFLNLTLGGVWSVSRSGSFNHGKEPWYILSRRLGGPRRWCGCFGEEKNLFFSPGVRTPVRPSHSLIAVPTMISRFPGRQSRWLIETA